MKARVCGPSETLATVVAEMQQFERQLRYGLLRARRRGVTERISEWAERLTALAAAQDTATKDDA